MQHTQYGTPTHKLNHPDYSLHFGNNNQYYNITKYYKGKVLFVLAI